uniref:CobW C-terminal domain-containing protein n=1 Tax=Quercus lobata TaxID=97700 RepID=A0A7N2LN85_QUELO
MASSISITADLASTFLSLSSRAGAAHRTRLSQVRATVLPFLLSPNNKTFQSQSHSLRFSFSTLSFNSSIIAAKPKRGLRRFTTAATATTTTTPQSEGSDLSSKIPADNRIPATIITGFLGSGKTTLLNHILTAEHGKRIAVIENEYGEVDIDGSLVAAKTTGAEDIVMLNNGCLCCTVRGDLVRMIAELVNRKKGKFDHIVIETTGLANPAPIIQTFYAEDQVFNDVKLDGVVTLVDAKHAGFHLDEVKPKGIVNEAVEQIAYADRIIVNKTDLVGEPEIATLVQRIRNINRMANLKRTEYGKVDLDYVLGIGGFDLERIESVVNAEGAKEDDHDHDHDHEHDHDHDHDHDHHHHHHHDEHDHAHALTLTRTRTRTRFAPTGQPGFGKFGAVFGGGYGVPFGVSRPRYGLLGSLGKVYGGSKVPSKVAFIVWTATLSSILTMDNPIKWKMVVNRCIMKHHDGHNSHDHSHDPGVSSVSIVCEGNLDLEKANMWLGTLLLERSEDIYRMKGLLSVQGMNERFVFQGVHDIFQGSPDRLWGQDEPRTNKIVFIGKNLDAQELEKGFKACLL